MLSFPALKDDYQRNWDNLKIRPSRLDDANKSASQLLKGKDIYQQIEAKTNVPWWFVGLCHSRESSFNFKTYLGNGQPLSQVTTEVPAGRGPFTGPNAFVDGGVDALRHQGFVGASDWSIARSLYRLEGFNGYGYHFHGVNSPYLYGGSTIYGPPEAKLGKFTADHGFDPGALDKQLGVAVVLKALMALDPSISFDDASPPVGGSSEPDDELAKAVLQVQQALNKLGIANPPLTEDGINGPKTGAAILQFQQQNHLQTTGLADAPTIAALAAKAPQMPIPIQDPGPMPAQPDLSAILQQLLTLVQGLKSPIVPTPTTPVPAPTDLSSILQQLVGLAQGLKSPIVPTPTTPSPAPTDLSSILQQLVGLAQGLQSPNITGVAGIPTPAGGPQLKQAVDLLSAVLGQIGKPPLGQVNGALGDTIGNMLNGKKAAIGIGGSLLTTLLAAFAPQAGGAGLQGILGTVSGFLPPQIALPLFLAVSAWGVLGKLEKWSQGTAPPPKLPS
jgi:lysozyme family protein/peptidoglycan hydrolase-like protein with peptidoglycan-binding domain